MLEWTQRKQNITICNTIHSLQLFAHCRSMSNVYKTLYSKQIHLRVASIVVFNSYNCSEIFVYIHFIFTSLHVIHFTYFNFNSSLLCVSFLHLIHTDRDMLDVQTHTMSINLEWMVLYLCAMGDGFMATKS